MPRLNVVTLFAVIVFGIFTLIIVGCATSTGGGDKQQAQFSDFRCQKWSYVPAIGQYNQCVDQNIVAIPVR